MTTATVKIITSDRQCPPGKLADAEIHFASFTPEARTWAESVLAITYGPSQTEAKLTQAILRQALALDGLKLIGFAIWERRTGGGRNVTFPARQYAVNGERRSFALLRPVTDATAQDHVRALILDAYAQHETALQAEPPAPPTVTATAQQPAAAGLF